MAFFEQTQVTNEKDVIVNPSSEESIILLRRMVKLMEASGNVDVANRQRITVDAGLPTGANTIGAVTVATVAAVTAITNALPAGTNFIGYMGMTGDTRIDLSRATFANAIRSRLTFS